VPGRRRRARFAELEGDVTALEGRDGWLFLSGDSNDVLGQHTGRVVPDRAWERHWRRLGRRRARLMRRIGAAHVQVAVPDKEAVYAEKLPDSVVPVARRPVHRLLELAPRCGIELIYPVEELRAARRLGPVFARTDSHWTGPAAYIAYRLVCDALAARGTRLPALDDEDIDWVEFDLVGDLGVKLDTPRRSAGIRPHVRERRARLLHDNRIRVTGRRLVLESDRPEAPRLVVFGTSYAVAALPFLAESASRLVYLHTTAVVDDLLLEERPDAVLVVSAERGLVRPPVDRGAAEMLAQAAARKEEAGLFAPEDELEPLGMPRLESGLT
jgi:hypothetical protein